MSFLVPKLFVCRSVLFAFFRGLAEAKLPLAYACLASIFVVIISFVNPPFMVADETNHFFRAVQISYLGIVGTKFQNGWAGGILPQDVRDFGYSFSGVAFNPAIRIDFSRVASLLHYSWSGAPVETAFANTVIYSPFFYLPAAFALFICRSLHLQLLQSFYVGRIFSGLCGVLVSTCALQICPPRARTWLLFCLCLPEVMGLYASFSQDGLFISCAALSSALLARGIAESQSGRPYHFWGLFVLLAMFVAAKPPYFPVLFLPVVLVSGNVRQRAAMCCLAGVCVVAWGAFGIHPVLTAMRLGDISPARQLHNLIAHPEIIPIVLHNTFIVNGRSLIDTCIATISWVDPSMPSVFYSGIIMVLLGLAFLYAVAGLAAGHLLPWPRLILGLMLVVGAGLGASLSTYLTWDEVGRDSIWGLLGRYFTALLFFLTPVIALPNESPITDTVLPKLNWGLVGVIFPLSCLSYLGTLIIRFWWPG